MKALDLLQQWLQPYYNFMDWLDGNWFRFLGWLLVIVVMICLCFDWRGKR